MDERAQRVLRVAAIVVFLTLVVFATFHGSTRFIHRLQKLAHPVTFGAVALLFLTLSPRRTPRRLGSYLAAFALTVLCGAATEVAQAFVHRDPSVFDVLRDALGASTALAGFAAIYPGKDARGRRGGRAVCALLAFAGFTLMVAPMSIALAAYLRRDFNFPTLVEACSPLDRYFIGGGGGAAVDFVPTMDSARAPCGRAVHVALTSEKYPGFSLDEPYPDWHEERFLILDLFNPGELDLSLVLRVHDRAHNFQYQDRFNREFALRAHESLEVTIPIADIEQAPQSRRMDLSHIAGLAVFRSRGVELGAFEVERIFLRR